MNSSKSEEITKTAGDRYAKRLLVRKKDLSQSFESVSKSLQRRKKIMDAISKNYMPPAATATKQNNNKDKDELEPSMSYCFQPAANVGGETAAKSRLSNPINSNFNDDIHYRHSSSQFRRRDIHTGLVVVHNTQSSPTESPQPKVSLDVPAGNFLSCMTCESKFEHYNNLKAQNYNRDRCIRGRESYLNARVLEILEPKVIHVEHKSSVDPLRVEHRRDVDDDDDNDKLPTAPPMEASDSTIVPFVSVKNRSAARELLERQQPNVNVKLITPKTSMYPNLSSMQRRMSDHCMTAQAQNESFDADACTKGNLNECCTAMSSKETFSTPMLMPIPMTPMQDQSTTTTSSISFLRRNASLIFSKVQQQLTRIRGKPNMESTRNLANSVCNNACVVLSASHCNGCTMSISTLTLPNCTPSSPGAFSSDREHYYAARTHLQSDDVADIQQGHRQGSEEALPLEVTNFLKMALGDDEEDCTVSLKTADCIIRTADYGIRKHPSTLNRSLSIYKTLTKNLKRRLKIDSAEKQQQQRDPRLSLQQQQQQHAHCRTTTTTEEAGIKKLLDLMEVYQTQIYQASKALELCNSMREFQASPERVELERLLIVASLGKRSAREEIRRVVRDDESQRHRRQRDSCCERAELELKDMRLQLREDELPAARRNVRLQRGAAGVDDELHCAVDWLLIVVSEGLTVWASQAVAWPSSCGVGGGLPQSRQVYFPGKLSLPGLAPDFLLSVSVYSMQLRPEPLYNHEDKYRIGDRGSGDLGCSPCSPCNSLSSDTSGRRRCKQHKHHQVRFSGIKEPMFRLCASLELSLDDLNRSSSAPWPLLAAAASGDSPPMQQQACRGVLLLDADLKCRLRLAVRHAGFLTHGDEPGGLIAWSRRWCVLDGRSLLFWNYPREHEDNKAPLYAIDLVHDCVSPRVELAERSLCPRPRTLLLETARRRSPLDQDSVVFQCRHSWTIVRNLLSCDTHQDLVEWQSKLNHVLCALREWRVIDTTTKSLQINDL